MSVALPFFLMAWPYGVVRNIGGTLMIIGSFGVLFLLFNYFYFLAFIPFILLFIGSLLIFRRKI